METFLSVAPIWLVLILLTVIGYFLKSRDTDWSEWRKEFTEKLDIKLDSIERHVMEMNGKVARLEQIQKNTDERLARVEKKADMT